LTITKGYDIILELFGKVYYEYKSIVLSIASIALAAGMALLASPVFAQSCTTQYGGSTTCMPSDLIINKQVQNPVNGVFVDNLTVSDPTFAPAANVLFPAHHPEHEWTNL